MRAPGPKSISVHQTVPVPHCKNHTEIKRVAGSCSLTGREVLHFSSDRVMVTRTGGLGVLLPVTEIFPPLSAKAFQ